MNNLLNHPLIKQSISHGIKFGLNTISLVLQALNNPHHQFQTIHVSGTNGKGSTCKMLAACLQENNYKTALFTSPHILKLNERFQINNKNISDQKLLNLLNQIQDIFHTLKALKKIESMTFFEICTACAFVFFKQENADIAIIETGMGGRLDSTNVIKSKNVIITNINYDHQNYLGTTLKEISIEKAGIIHPGCNVVTGSMSKEITNAIKQSKHYSYFYKKEKDFTITQNPISKKLLYSSKRGFLNNYRFKLPLKGGFQNQNCSLVLKTLENLQEQGYSLNKLLIKKGLNKIIWPGRLDVISKSPLIIFDAAHNPNAIEQLLISIKNLYPDKKFAFIVGCMKDKNYSKMIKEVTDYAKEVILIPLHTSRSLSLKDLNLLSKNSKKIKIKSDFRDAIHHLISSAKKTTKDKNIVVCGSFYMLEQAYQWVNINLHDKE